MEAEELLQVNCFEYLNRSHEVDEPETVVEDATVSGLKGTLEEVFPHRLRHIRSLIEFVPKDRARKIVEEGVALIKTIPEEESHRKIVNYILRVFHGLADREDLIAYIMKIGEVDEDRAIIIADDQMHKAAERFLVEKWKNQGCKRVRWVHKDDTNPRKYHLRPWNGVSGKRNGRPNGLNGYEFDIDKPPVINQKTKERGYPGHMINCHCRLEPIWD